MGDNRGRRRWENNAGARKTLATAQGLVGSFDVHAGNAADNARASGVRSMKIASAASAFPKHYYSQKVLLEKLQEYWGDQLRNPQMLARLHRNVTVEGRHLAIPPEQ